MKVLVEHIHQLNISINIKSLKQNKQEFVVRHLKQEQVSVKMSFRAFLKAEKDMKLLNLSIFWRMFQSLAAAYWNDNSPYSDLILEPSLV